VALEGQDKRCNIYYLVSDRRKDDVLSNQIRFICQQKTQNTTEKQNKPARKNVHKNYIKTQKKHIVKEKKIET